MLLVTQADRLIEQTGSLRLIEYLNSYITVTEVKRKATCQSSCHTKCLNKLTNTFMNKWLTV